MLEWAIAADVSAYQQSIEEKEEEFNNVVRENIIALLTFIVLYIISYFVVLRYHEKRERDSLYGADEDAQAYRISFYLCTFTLAVSCGAIFMLPMSMIGNEVVHLHPDSYWVQWLNGALVHTFWQWIFVFSNVSLFLLLPFSYFFTESEGFSGQRRGLMPRVYETITVLLLLAVVVFGFSVLALAFFDRDDAAQGIIAMVFEYFLQYLYSFLLCVSVFFMVAGCAPIGFITLFDAVGHLLVKPKIFENNDDQIAIKTMEEESMQRKLKSKTYLNRISKAEHHKLQLKMQSTRHTRIKLEKRKNASAFERNIGYPLVMLILLALTGLALFMVSIHILKLVFIGDHELHPSTVKEEFGKDYRKFSSERTCPKIDGVDSREDKSQQQQQQQQHPRRWWRFWSPSPSKDPLPPASPERCQDLSNSHNGAPSHDDHKSRLGASSLSAFGMFGTVLEVLVIFYLTLASLIGFYNLPGFRLIRPRPEETAMTKVIANCVAIQLLSSSLPVLSRVLGITNFDLQGNFGSFYWLGDFYIIFAFNVIFATVTALCLVNKVTAKIRRELYKAMQHNRATLIRLARKHAHFYNGSKRSPSFPPSSQPSASELSLLGSQSSDSIPDLDSTASEATVFSPPRGHSSDVTPRRKGSLTPHDFLASTAPKTAHHR